MKLSKKVLAAIALISALSFAYAQDETSVENEYLTDVDGDIITTLAESDDFENKLVALQYLESAIEGGNTSPAVIAALDDNFTWLKPSKATRILFAGNNISEDYLTELIDYLKTVRFGVINISKSGTTTETAITFRLMKKLCEDQMGKETAKKVIVAITDAKKGAARTCADKEGYKTFVIPDNVG